MNLAEITIDSYISKDLARDKDKKTFIKDVFSVRVKHEPSGKTVELDEGLPRDSRKWTDICLAVREKALAKLERLVQP